MTLDTAPEARPDAATGAAAGPILVINPNCNEAVTPGWIWRSRPSGCPAGRRSSASRSPTAPSASRASATAMR